MISGPTISLAHGGYFNFLDPHANMPKIADIARGLSNCCRYAGQVHDFYSTAEHCVHASMIVDPAEAYNALMHDAAEALIHDITKPLKNLLGDYQKIEYAIENALMEHFEFAITPAVKHADVQMLLAEKEQIKENFDKWSWTDGIEAPDIEIECNLPYEAFEDFMMRFYEVAPDSVVAREVSLCAWAPKFIEKRRFFAGVKIPDPLGQAGRVYQRIAHHMGAS